MNYTLSIRTNSSPHAFEIGYPSKADGEAAIFKALENGYFLSEDYACILGPGVRMQLRSADADEHEDGEIEAAHYIVLTMLGQMIALAYRSELEMKVALGGILRHRCFNQTFKDGRDTVFVCLEPGTTALFLTAAAFEQLIQENKLRAPGAPNPSKKILLS